MRLAERFPVDVIQDSLVVPAGWSAFPPVDERAAWEAVPGATRDDLRTRAEEHLGKAWSPLPATLFMEFQRTGNRSHYEIASFGRRMQLVSLVMGECVEDRGRFLDDIVDGVWAICEESFWDVAAHNHRSRSPGQPLWALPDPSEPVVALFSAETGATLAWTVHLVGSRLDTVDPIISQRVHSEIRARLLDPFMARDDWRWLGFETSDRPGPPNNWNPWIISNLLTMAMLVETDPARRAGIVHKCLRGLDKFIEGYHPDGGCDEGISYWGRAAASLYECLDVLDRASGGAITVWDEPLLGEMARYVPRAHIGGPWYVNFADATALAAPDPNVLYHFGQRIGDGDVMRHAIVAQTETKPSSQPRFQSFNRALNEVFRPVPDGAAESAYPLPLQSWLGGIQVLTAREHAGSTDGLFLAAKGGHNGESHNHNDIGTFIVALDGYPMLIDAGVGEYTRQTFSDRRYELWPMQSAYHNLPTIDGHQQQPGSSYAARDVTANLAAERAELRLDIAGAWAPEAGLLGWTRVVRLERGPEAAVVLEDAWQLSREPVRMVLTLMTAGDIDLATPGRLAISGPGRGLHVAADPDVWSVATERIEIDDSRLTPVWGDSVTRLLLTFQQPAAQGSWRLRITPANS